MAREQTRCDHCKGKGKTGGFFGFGARPCPLCDGAGWTTGPEPDAADAVAVEHTPEKTTGPQLDSVFIEVGQAVDAMGVSSPNRTLILSLGGWTDPLSVCSTTS